MVLDVTLAVMNGFRDQIQLKFVENMPMVSIMPGRTFEDLEGMVEADVAAADEEPKAADAAPATTGESKEDATGA